MEIISLLPFGTTLFLHELAISTELPIVFDALLAEGTSVSIYEL